MLGIGFGINKNKYTGTGAGAPRTAYYVDSVTGSDANDGLTDTTPFEHLSAIPLANNIDIYLARDSVFHEQLDGTPFSGCRIFAYGSGKLPTIDGADTAANASFVVDGTHANVYNQTLTYESDIPGHYLSMWEDGVRLFYVDDKATCQATPGSWTAEEVDAFTEATGSQVFSIHPYGSTNPTTDGKLYEYSARGFCVASGHGWSVNNIRTKRQINNNGSFVLSINSVANGCIFEDGVKHNAFGESNTTFNDCIAWKCDWPNRTNLTGFVSFEVNPSGKATYYNRCIALMEEDKYDWALANGASLLGFYCHSDGAPGHNWGEVNYTECATKLCTEGLAVADTNVLNDTRNLVESASIGINANAITVNSIDAYIRDGDGKRLLRGYTGGTDGVINGLRIYTVGRGGAGLFYDIGNDGQTTISNSVIYRAAGVGYTYAVQHTGTKILNFYNNIVYIDQSLAEGASLATNNPNLIDFNVYSNEDTDFEINGNNYFDFGDYVAAEPHDQNSVTGDPLFVDAANGDFNLQVGSPAIALGAGLLRPDVVYTTIPSHATVEAM